MWQENRHQAQLGFGGTWVPNDGMQTARAVQDFGWSSKEGAGQRQGESRAHPASSACSSYSEGGRERFQTLIPSRTSLPVFSGSALPQEDALKLTEKDRGSEVCANACSDTPDRCKAAFMGISERLLAAPPELRAGDVLRSPRPVTFRGH